MSTGTGDTGTSGATNGSDGGGGGVFRRYYDSLLNTLSNLGTTKDRTHRDNQQVAEVRELSPQELEVLYRRNHYAARVVDLVPDESTRRGFEVTVSSDDDDDDEGDPFAEDFERLGLIPALNYADKMARLYGGAAVILGLDDGADPAEPLDWKAVQRGETVARSLDYVHVVDRQSLTAGLLENDPTSPGFGLPATYQLSLRDQGMVLSAQQPDGGGDGTSELLSFGQHIHATRMLRFFGVRLPTVLAADQDWWGDSVLQRVFEAMANLGMVERAMGNIVQTFTQAVFRMKGLRNLVRSNDGEEQLLDRMVAMNLSQSILNMMVIDADGEEFTKRTTNVAGLSDLYDRMAQSFGAAAGFPLTMLFGIPPAGLSTDDEAGARNAENKVRAHQELVYVPAIRKVAELLAATEEGPDLAQGRMRVLAVPLTEPTEAEQATTAKTWAEFAAILIDRGVLRPSEVRHSFFAGPGFSPDVVLEEEVGQQPDPVAALLLPPSTEQGAGGIGEQEGEQQIGDLLQLMGTSEDEVREAVPANMVLDQADPDDMEPQQQPKTQVNYTDISPGQETCDRCGWFVEPDACRMVEGDIDPDGWCVLWGTLRFAPPRTDAAGDAGAAPGKGREVEREDTFTSFAEAPDNIKTLANEQEWTSEQRRQWVSVFNDVFARLRERGLSVEEAESRAIQQATGVVTRT